jgi:hypothetical protein
VWFSGFSRLFALMADLVRRPVERDPLVAALARYVEALHRRYPEGPEQLRRERLAAARNRANVSVMDETREAGAA